MSVLLSMRTAVFQNRESPSCRGCGRGEQDGNILCTQCASAVSKALFAPAAPFEHAHGAADLSITRAAPPARRSWDGGVTCVEHHLSSKESMDNNADAVLICRMLRQADRVKSKSLRAYLGATAEHRVLKVQRRESTEMGVQTHVRHSLR